MPRQPRIDLPHAMHHVASRANADRPLFREPADRRQFLDELTTVIDKYEWRCSAYCLMGSHFHLILYTVQPTLSAGMARLCASYAQWLNWKYDGVGHVFASRFMSRHITQDAHLMEAHRYIALNPVRAEHCDHPAAWRWGSYRALAGLERAPEFLDLPAVHGLFGSPRAYRDFVLDSERLGSDPSRGQTPEVRASMKLRKVSATRPTASS